LDGKTAINFCGLQPGSVIGADRPRNRRPDTTIRGHGVGPRGCTASRPQVIWRLAIRRSGGARQRFCCQGQQLIAALGQANDSAKQ